MKMKSLIGVSLAMMCATIFAGEKIAPDLNNLAQEWKLSSAKIIEENGEKYLKLQKPDKGTIASMSYPDISLQGVKLVKISLKYRSDVYSTGLHGGSWYLVGFKLADGKVKYDGIVLSKATEWTVITKTFDVPENAKSLILALRLQDSSANNFLDARDIVIELLK
jgi:hypothetical protein